MGAGTGARLPPFKYQVVFQYPRIFTKLDARWGESLCSDCNTMGLNLSGPEAMYLMYLVLSSPSESIPCLKSCGKFIPHVMDICDSMVRL